jgi:hypothetical protein
MRRTHFSDLPTEETAMNANAMPEEPSDLEAEPIEPTEPSDLDCEDMPCTDDAGEDDDSRWDVFIPDDDELDPQPDVGDFWIENRGSLVVAARPSTRQVLFPCHLV